MSTLAPAKTGPSLAARAALAARGLAASMERRFESERDQLPLWLPVGLILGIALYFWLPDRNGWIAVLAGAAALALGAGAFAGATRAGRALCLFAIAAAIGCGHVWWKAERVTAPRLARDGLVETTALVVSVQRMAAEGTRRLVVAPDDRALAARLRVNVDEEDVPAGLDAGARIRLRAWMMPPPPMAAPGAYDFARAAWFQQLGGTGRALEIEIVAPPDSRGWRARIAGWRDALASHVRDSIGGGAEGGIAAALATGDQYGIPEEDAEAMRRSGLAHLLSVSGLHLTAAVGAVMLLTLKLLALSPALALRFRLVVIAAFAGAVAGIAYTLLTGAEVPTVRACIAALLVLAGIALGRDALTLRLVAVGALAVLLLWPESLAGPSFQLSFAAIVAIVALHENPRIQALLSRRDEGAAARTGRFLLGLALTGLAVELALTPIALFHFHRSGLYGAAANIVAIPLTTFVIMPLEALALLLDLVGLGAPAWWLTGRALAFLVWLAHAAANAPGAVALLPAMPRGAFALIVAGGLWICLWRTGWRRLGILPAAIGALWAFSVPPPDVIATGDGRHLVLRTPTGGLALLRPKAGDYVRETLAELAGAEPEYRELEGLPTVACSPELCAVYVDRVGRRWRILVTRSRHFVRWDQMVRACAAADIVIADRLLPRACAPRWLRADRAFLRRTGGFSLTLGERPRLATVAGQVGRHPWAD
ncbi:ComEC/Rec2 family competence protein [Sphingosinicella terrae]|uniref:ComEC/Rec2 family competence protein n=1 Tax=Sphingosinicella terrae TaxID=2172047 RepID=UPI000E0DD1FF|nr:ComEC/Rec2 family competence protein [Sphingosinicella terrae]